MMYWTSTGTLTSIKTRNKLMWGDSGVRRMDEIWNAGLDTAIETQLQRDEICWGRRGGVTRMKAYFPNIIMIDFADPGKCQTIYDLNTAADNLHDGLVQVATAADQVSTAVNQIASSSQAAARSAALITSAG